MLHPVPCSAVQRRTSAAASSAIAVGSLYLRSGHEREVLW